MLHVIVELSSSTVVGSGGVGTADDLAERGRLLAEAEADIEAGNTTSVKRHPYAGRAIRSGVGKRELVVGDYILVYRVRDDTRILRVWHHAQNRPG